MAAAEPVAAPMVLMYHSVAPYDVDPHRVTVSPSRFAEQMRLLHRLGIRGMSMRQLLGPPDPQRPGARVGLTFDDGYQDFLTTAMPVLLRYGFTATVFVVADSLGGHNHWDLGVPRKALLSADELGRVAEAGMEVGSHGLRHVSLPSLADEALREEVCRSRQILQRLLGRPPAGFCYPYGDVTAREAEAVRAAGYDYGCVASCSGWAGRYATPRTYVGDRDGAARLVAKWARHRLARSRVDRRDPARAGWGKAGAR